MKVLFAVNNDNVSNAIIKKYQKNYKEIITYKNVYYFNAILKELQNDKTYDRVIISEDLEPFANNNYDTIDKFLFEKLDKISDEATKTNGDNIDIILICSDRRKKADEMLTKIFGIGIYNALIEEDRNIDMLCKLLNQPRTKKEAKIDYKIAGSNVGYQAEDENSVSEAEVQNILAHYKRLGKDEDRYVDSFNNIVSQYTDGQLRIIIKYLPLNVKAVLEERSPKYQELATFAGKENGRVSKTPYTPRVAKETKKEEKIKIKMLQDEKDKISKPIVIPSALANKKKILTKPKDTEDVRMTKAVPSLDEQAEQTINEFETEEEEVLEEVVNQEPKRGRGRPRKNPQPTEETNTVKRGRGRPRKVVPEVQDEEVEEKDEKNEKEELEEDVYNFDLPDVEEIENKTDFDNTMQSNEEEAFDLFDLDDNNSANENEDTDVDADNDADLFNMTDDTDNSEEVDTVEYNESDGNDEKEIEDEDLFDIETDNEVLDETDSKEQEENYKVEDDDIDLFSLDDDESDKVDTEEQDEQEGFDSEDDEDVDLFNITDDDDGDDDSIENDESDEEELEEDLDEDSDVDEIEYEDEFDNEDDEDVDLFNITDDNEDSIEKEKKEYQDDNYDENEDELDLSDLEEADDDGLEEDDDEAEEFYSDEEPEYEEIKTDFHNTETDNTQFNINKETNTEEKRVIGINHTTNTNNFNNVLTKDRKIVTFVGTTKNGTSFIVNNLALTLASMNISTAILDMTKTKNAYYIFTKNEQGLRNIAENSITKLSAGEADGIEVNRNLTVYTELPGKSMEELDVTTILTTLAQKHEVVLIDADFDTDFEFFEKSQEIYLVQSMDILTIQPLTAFLRNLKSKEILKQEKLKIIINKWEKIKNLSDRVLIGGISSYNDPAMSYMTELFDKDKILYCKIPFEAQNYVKYISGLVDCELSLKGYTKQLSSSLKELASMVYPLLGKQSYSPMGNKKERMDFSDSTKDTLNKMKKNY